MNIAMFARFPGTHEWRVIHPSVVFYLLFMFYPRSQTGELIQEHLGLGSELVLPDDTLLRFLTVD